MPTDVDGTFVAVGGAGLIPFLKAYEQAHGPIDGKKFIGNLFWGTPGSSSSSPPASRAPTSVVPARPATSQRRPRRLRTHHRQVVQDDPAVRRRRAAGIVDVHVRLLRQHLGPVRASGGRRATSPAARRSCRRPSARWLADAVRPDQARQEPPGDLNVFYRSSTRRTASSPSKTVGDIPGVDQTFGGTFSSNTPAPGRNFPRARSEACRGSARRMPRRSPASRRVTEAAAPEHAEPILRLRGIGRRFGGLLAVRDVDLDVAHGERRAILGPNGAGKTTLFNVISGDVTPTSGTIEFLGDDVTHAAAAGTREARDGPHVPEVPALSRPVGRGQPLPRRPRRARRATCARSCCRARPRAARARARARARPSGSRPRADARRLALARRAAPARGRPWRAPANPR